MQLDFSVRGEGPALVLIHGLFGTRENLGALARVLSESFTVYSLDLPNHGRSSHIDHFNLSDMASAVITWMDEQALQSAHFFGHSLGGKVAMEVALTASTRVERLVVADIAPVKYGQRHQDVFDGLLAVNLDAISSRVDAEEILAKTISTKAVRSFLLKNLQRDANGKFYWRMHLQALYDNYANIIDGNLDTTSDCPALFLKAENSDYIVPEYRDAIVRRFPNAQSKVVSNTGHWLHAEKPELVALLAKNFYLE